MAPLPPSSPQREPGSSRPFLLLLLIIACAGVGALLAWGTRQRHERARLFERNLEIEKSYVVVLAQRSDLAGFLTNPKTHLFRLIGRGEAGGRVATVAWQEETRTGILIADEVAPPSDRLTYAMWHIDPHQQPTLCGGFKPDPTGTIFDFRCVAPTEGTAGFQISIEPDLGAKMPGRVVYETR